MGISGEKSRTYARSSGVLPVVQSEFSQDKPSTTSGNHAVQATKLSAISDQKLSMASRPILAKPAIRSGLSSKDSTSSFKLHAVQTKTRPESCKENLSVNSRNNAEQPTVQTKIPTKNLPTTPSSQSVQPSARSSQSQARSCRVETHAQLLPESGRGRDPTSQPTKGYAIQPSQSARPMPGSTAQGGASSTQARTTQTSSTTPGSALAHRHSPPPTTSDRGEATPSTDIGTLPTPAPPGPRQLQLVALQPKDYPNRSHHCYHWGLLLMRDERIGDLYHSVRGREPRSNHPPDGQPRCTACIWCRRQPNPCRGCVDGSSGAGTGYEIRSSYDPDASAHYIVYKRTTVPKPIDTVDLDRICRLVDARFPYSLMGNNCQKFAVRVLQQMVHDGIITHADFDAVRRHMYEAKLATWDAIRGRMPDLRPPG